MAEKHHPDRLRPLVRLKTAMIGPGILFAVTVLFFWKLVLTNQYTFMESPDLANQVLPWYQFQAGEWHQGRFPLWEPFQWGGQPLIGQAQPGAAYPLNWLLFSLPLRNGWIRQAYLHWYFVVIHYLGVLFCYFLCRDLGRTRRASIIAGLIFGLSGFLGTNEWPQMLNGAIWAPLVFLFLLRNARDDRPVANACLSGAFLGMAWLSGHHQIPIFISLAAGITWLYFLFLRRDWRVLRLIAAFGAFTFLVSAMQTLPAFEYGRNARRWVGSQDPVGWKTEVPYLVHEQYSFKPESMLGLVFPGMHRHQNGFMGVVALSLAFVALALAFAIPWVRLFGAIAIGGLLLALGSATLFHGLFYALIPMVEKARSPSMAIFIFNFGISILIAYGIDHLDVNSSTLIRRLAIGLAVFAAIIWTFVAGLALAGKTPSDERALMTALFALLSAGVFYSVWRGALLPHSAALALGLISLLELSTVTGSYWPNRNDKDRNPYLRKIPEIAAAVQFLQTRSQPIRVDVDDKEVPFNAGDMYGFPQLNGYLASLTENLIYPEFHKPRTQQLFAVEYFLGRAPRFPGHQVVFEGPNGLNVYRSAGTFPRVRTVHHVQSLRVKDEIASFIADPKNDLQNTVALVDRALPSLETCSGDDVNLTRHAPTHVSISASMQCKGMVILADTYFPGWHATVDKKSVEILEAYGFMRGVVVDKGDHIVEMTYAPASFKLGAVLTGIGVFSSVLIGFFLTRRVNYS